MFETMNDIPLALGSRNDLTGEPAVLLELEHPQAGAVIYADDTLVGYGWALAASPILSIAVALDGQRLCAAQTSLERQDVAEMHPDHPNSLHSGFVFVMSLTGRASGFADLRLTLRTEAGDHTHILQLEIVGHTNAPTPPTISETAELPADLKPNRLALE